MYKRIQYIVLALIIFMSTINCWKQTDTSFTIEGNVTEYGTNEPIKDVIMYLMCDYVSHQEVLDTTHTDELGYFRFERENDCGVYVFK